MSVSRDGQDYTGGAPPKNRHRPMRAWEPFAPPGMSQVRFTPPCECGYPMLRGEKACLRCGREREL